MTEHHIPTRTAAPRRRAFRRALGTVLLTAVVAACGSTASDDNDIDDRDTVVPPVSAGVDGGVPNDNLNPELDGPADDVDGDGAPDG